MMKRRITDHIGTLTAPETKTFSHEDTEIMRISVSLPKVIGHSRVTRRIDSYYKRLGKSIWRQVNTQMLKAARKQKPLQAVFYPWELTVTAAQIQNSGGRYDVRHDYTLRTGTVVSAWQTTECWDLATGLQIPGKKPA
jgi:hypothetical protein